MARPILFVNGEKLGGNDLTTVTTLEAVEVKSASECSHELARKRLATLFADAVSFVGVGS